MVKMAKKGSGAPERVNVADAKARFSELIGRVAFGGATVVITRRGKPMARLIPPHGDSEAPHLADVKGWLDETHPLFSTVDDIVAARARHTPRALRRPPRSRG